MAPATNDEPGSIPAKRRVSAPPSGATVATVWTRPLTARASSVPGATPAGTVPCT
ncbi:MAG TPA: hypothetical protein VIJ32_04545 [Actinomycetes bacterium]